MMYGDAIDASTPAASPFTVSTARGFLPLADPPSSLPAAFEPLERLLCAMPVRRADGLPGLLAEGALGEAVDKELPDLSREVERTAGDPALVTALYRDYSFLASAYLLEPCKSSRRSVADDKAMWRSYYFNLVFMMIAPDPDIVTFD